MFIPTFGVPQTLLPNLDRRSHQIEPITLDHWTWKRTVVVTSESLMLVHREMHESQAFEMMVLSGGLVILCRTGEVTIPPPVCQDLSQVIKGFIQQGDRQSFIASVCPKQFREEGFLYAINMHGPPKVVPADIFDLTIADFPLLPEGTRHHFATCAVCTAAFLHSARLYMQIIKQQTVIRQSVEIDSLLAVKKGYRVENNPDDSVFFS